MWPNFTAILHLIHGSIGVDAGTNPSEGVIKLEGVYWYVVVELSGTPLLVRKVCNKYSVLIYFTTAIRLPLTT